MATLGIDHIEVVSRPARSGCNWDEDVPVLVGWMSIRILKVVTDKQAAASTAGVDSSMNKQRHDLWTLERDSMFRNILSIISIRH